MNRIALFLSLRVRRLKTVVKEVPRNEITFVSR